MKSQEKKSFSKYNNMNKFEEEDIHKTYKCATCKTRLKSKYKFREHVRLNHKRKPFYCQICESHLALTNIGKKNHIKVHKENILNDPDINNDFHLTKHFSGTDNTLNVAKEFIKVYQNSSLSYDPLDRHTLIEIFQLVQGETLDTGLVKIQVAFKLVWGNDTDDDEIKYSFCRIPAFIWSSGRRDFDLIMNDKMQPIRALINDPIPEEGSGFIYLGTKEVSLITAHLPEQRYGYKCSKYKTLTQLENYGVNTTSLIYPNTKVNCFAQTILIGLYQASNNHKLGPVIKRKLENDDIDLTYFKSIIKNLPQDIVNISDINEFAKSNPKLGIKIIQLNQYTESNSWIELYISPNFSQSSIKIELLSTPPLRIVAGPFFHHLCYINNFSSLIRKTHGKGRTAKRASAQK
jgi:hypothetical protein